MWIHREKKKRWRGGVFWFILNSSSCFLLNFKAIRYGRGGGIVAEIILRLLLIPFEVRILGSVRSTFILTSQFNFLREIWSIENSKTVTPYKIENFIQTFEVACPSAFFKKIFVIVSVTRVTSVTLNLSLLCQNCDIIWFPWLLWRHFGRVFNRHRRKYSMKSTLWTHSVFLQWFLPVRVAVNGNENQCYTFWKLTSISSLHQKFKMSLWKKQ